MKRNPILEELHAIREHLLTESGGDFQKFLDGLRQREAASGRLRLPTNEEATRPSPSREAPASSATRFSR